MADYYRPSGAFNARVDVDDVLEQFGIQTPASRRRNRQLGQVDTQLSNDFVIGNRTADNALTLGNMRAVSENQNRTTDVLLGDQREDIARRQQATELELAHIRANAARDPAHQALLEAQTEQIRQEMEQQRRLFENTFGDNAAGGDAAGLEALGAAQSGVAQQETLSTLNTLLANDEAPIMRFGANLGDGFRSLIDGGAANVSSLFQLPEENQRMRENWAAMRNLDRLNQGSTPTIDENLFTRLVAEMPELANTLSRGTLPEGVTPENIDTLLREILGGDINNTSTPALRFSPGHQLSTPQLGLYHN